MLSPFLSQLSPSLIVCQSFVCLPSFTLSSRGPFLAYPRLNSVPDGRHKFSLSLIPHVRAEQSQKCRHHSSRLLDESHPDLTVSRFATRPAVPHRTESDPLSASATFRQLRRQAAVPWRIPATANTPAPHLLEAKQQGRPAAPAARQ
jgi:hypothetical protein